MNSGQDLSTRELAREITHLAQSIEALTSEIREELMEIRKEMVRSDVYDAQLRTDTVEKTEILRRLDGLENRSKSLMTAFTGMSLSVLAGIIVYLITRGLTL